MNIQNTLTYSNAMTQNRHYIDERSFVEELLLQQPEGLSRQLLSNHTSLAYA